MVMFWQWTGATEEHNDIVANLIGEIRSFLKDRNCKIRPSDFRVTTPAGKNYFYPDASIVCGPIQKQPGVFDTLLNPVVIFEVMSKGTEHNDRGYKFFYYQQIPSLQEYVLVDSREYSVEILRRQPDGAWRIEKYSPGDGAIHLTAIDYKLSLSEIYFKVQLPRSE